MSFSSIEQKELMCIIPQSSWEILSTTLISCFLLRAAMDCQSRTWLLIVLYHQDKPSPQQEKINFSEFIFLCAHDVAVLLLGAVPGRLWADASMMKRTGAEWSPAGKGSVANSSSLGREPNQHLSPQSLTVVVTMETFLGMTSFCV